MRRVIVPHRLAIPTSVRAAPPSASRVEKEGMRAPPSASRVEKEGMREPVSPLLEALAEAPGDNSAKYCGGVRRRGRSFGEGQPRENEKKGKRKGELPRGERVMCTALE